MLDVMHNFSWARSEKERPTDRSTSKESMLSATMAAVSEVPGQLPAFSGSLLCWSFEAEMALDVKLALVEVLVSKAAVVWCCR